MSDKQVISFRVFSVFSLCSLSHCAHRSLCVQFMFSFALRTQKFLCSVYVLFPTVHTEDSVFSLCSLSHCVHRSLCVQFIFSFPLCTQKFVCSVYVPFPTENTEVPVFSLCSLSHCAHRRFCVQLCYVSHLHTEVFTLSFLLLRNLQWCTFLPTKRKFCLDGPHCCHCRRLHKGAVLCDCPGLGTSSSPQTVSVTVH
jgi:hypothetical protein